MVMSGGVLVTAAVLMTKRRDEGLKWKCDVNGGCIQVSEGGVWSSPDECRCGMCVNGECEVAGSGGGAYPTLDACLSDGGLMCKDESLGWECSQNSGVAEACHQVLGGSARTREECRCWSCDGEPPGPGSKCTFDASNEGEYETFDSCLHDEEKKCGWMYGCKT
jgi:hypothetical protein